MNEPRLHTRREFLRTSMLGGALTWTVPSFLQATMQSLHAADRDSAVQGLTGKDSPILVVVQLAGGNDGLNTVVPFANDDYRRARPQLGLGRDEVLKIDDQVGLHPSLKGMKGLLDAGDLAIVQGVGYPNPNRSHFRSTEIWATASDADRNESYGWIGRFFDNTCEGCPADAGIAIGGQTPQAFLAKNPKGVTFQNPNAYRLMESSYQMKGDDPEDEMFRDMNALTMGDNEGGSIGTIGSTAKPHDGESGVDFLQRTVMDAQVSSDRIRGIAAKFRNKAAYGSTRLAQELKLVAQLIGGGLSTRVFYVSHGGFDTHNNQLSSHQRLLQELGDALAAFAKDMKEQGNWPRVTVMTFSEFGRRVAQNANGGTDHGTAAPMFLAGGGIKPGLHGTMPDLAAAKLDKGDLRHTVDFRSVYATVLERRLKVASKPVLGRAFPVLDLA